MGRGGSTTLNARLWFRGEGPLTYPAELRLSLAVSSLARSTRPCAYSGKPSSMRTNYLHESPRFQRSPLIPVVFRGTYLS